MVSVGSWTCEKALYEKVCFDFLLKVLSCTKKAEISLIVNIEIGI